ncbi:MAG: hypothetical protein H8E26_13675 [FCB group bacterium]|nr:hypothetical protein [FCB group bacterium]
MSRRIRRGNSDNQAMIYATAEQIDSSVFIPINQDTTVPASWDEKARQSWRYYIEEPLVNNVINTWRTFAIGDEIKVSVGDESVRSDAQKLFSSLNLNSFVKDMILQLLIKGDAIGFKEYSKDGKSISRVSCVNPVSIQVKYEDSVLIEARQSIKTSDGGVGKEIDLPVKQLCHFKWNAPEFSDRGNSMIIPAFHAIGLLRDYRKAERAIAKRWTTPLRFIQVGGKFGDKVIMPDQKMLKNIRDQINKMDLKSGLVVPFYVRAETYGNEGQVLDTEKKVAELKEDILVALGLSKSLVTGDGPNFATANIAMRKMIIMLKEIKQVARNMLAWIYDDWKELSGVDENVQYFFSDMDLSDEKEVRKMLIELYDRNLISKNTLQTKMDLNPQIENTNRQQEKSIVDMTWDVKDIVSMVQLGIMSVDTAREILGLNPEEESKRTVKTEAADINELFASGKILTESQDLSAITAEIKQSCGDCIYWEGRTNFCPIHSREKTFDDDICRQFSGGAIDVGPIPTDTH